MLFMRQMERVGARLSQCPCVGYAPVPGGELGPGSAKYPRRRRRADGFFAPPDRLSPPPADAPVALAECAHRLRDADERTDDLQCPPASLWGKYGANFDYSWLTFHGRPIPGWATIPSTYNLAAARRWHLAFAWLLVVGLALFLLVSLINRHVQRDLAPTSDEVAPKHIWHDIREHARLRFPTGDARFATISCRN